MRFIEDLFLIKITRLFFKSATPGVSLDVAFYYHHSKRPRPTLNNSRGVLLVEFVIDDGLIRGKQAHIMHELR